MRYQRAVEKLRILAGAEEVPWESSPQGTQWLVDQLQGYLDLYEATEPPS